MAITKGPWHWEWMGTAGNYGLFNSEMEPVVDRSWPLEHGEKFPDDIQAIVALPDLLTACKTILALIGNVDHSTGNGARSAKMRGDLLNSIREIARNAAAKAEGGTNA